MATVEVRLDGAQAMVDKLNTIKTQLATSRDELRELESEIVTLLDDKDEEIANLESVIDSLSQYV